MTRSPRQPVRSTARPEIRDREGNIIGRRRDDTGGSQFHIPTNKMEAGWSLQWVRQSCYGKEDPANMHNHQENGWRPVPSSRFDGMFHPKGYEGAVSRDGLVLMERPQALTDQALDEDYRSAIDQRISQTVDFGMGELPPGLTSGHGFAAKKVGNFIEGVPESSYPSHVIGDDD